jgi:hypothetical protein
MRFIYTGKFEGVEPLQESSLPYPSTEI